MQLKDRLTKRRGRLVARVRYHPLLERRAEEIADADPTPKTVVTGTTAVASN